MDDLKTPYFTFAMNQSLANSDYFRSLDLDEKVMTAMKEMSAKSNQDRQVIENAEDMDFESYLVIMNNS